MSENEYLSRPWLAISPQGGPSDITPKYGTVLQAFVDTTAARPQAAAIHYFDRTMSYRQLDDLSTASAKWLALHSIEPGDRVMIMLQNTPQFHIATLGAWKAGAIVVPINPMYKRMEVLKLLKDSRAKVLLCHPETLDEVEAAASNFEQPILIAQTSARALRSVPDDSENFEGREVAGAGVEWLDLLNATEIADWRPAEPDREDIAALMYTSGTTGAPKGAIIRHGGLAFSAEVAVQWFAMREAVRVLGVAPLFHITGLVVNFAAPILVGGVAVLTYRFAPRLLLDVMASRRPHVMVAAITAYIALLNCDSATPDHFASFDGLFSGGAPVPPSVVNRFDERFGRRIHTAYGMTETTAATHVSPIGSRIPVDPESGALAIGIPVSCVVAAIVDDAGNAVPVGEIGELVVMGPQMMAGYWERPEETAATLKNDWLHTGDIGFMDAEGWFYLVDRKKDMISAAGFKVWPREIEDVLYAHPAVREAAVFGAPDDYRGETVQAAVSLKADAAVTEAELLEFCRSQLAAFKVPRAIRIHNDLPKTESGKIMRYALRPRSL